MKYFPGMKEAVFDQHDLDIFIQKLGSTVTVARIQITVFVYNNS